MKAIELVLGIFKCIIFVTLRETKKKKKTKNDIFWKILLYYNSGNNVGQTYLCDSLTETEREKKRGEGWGMCAIFTIVKIIQFRVIIVDH